MTNQPEFKCVANLGDATPWHYGGAFVLVDQTGVYTPELRVITVPGYSLLKNTLLLEPCTYVDKILSDNKYHPDFPAWFADRLPEAARFSGRSQEDLITALCSDDPIERAQGYLVLFDFFGPQEPSVVYTPRNKIGIINKMKRWLREIETS